MFNKKIANIVFYKIDNSSEKQACIFYQDGTVKNISFEEGIDACEVLVKENNITSKDAFQQMINNKLVHVLSGKDFSNRFASFIPTQVTEQKEEQEDKAEIQTTNTPTETIVATAPVTEMPTEQAEETSETEEERVNDVYQDAQASVQQEIEKMKNAQISESEEEKEEPLPTEMTEEENREMLDLYAKARKSMENDEEDTETYETGTGDEDPFEESADTSIDTEIEDKNTLAEQQETKPEEKKGFFKRAWEKIKKNKIIKRITVCVTALALATGLFACSSKRSLEGQMINSNLATTTTATDADELTAGNIALSGNNAYYDNYTFDQLQQVTVNQAQKTAMFNINSALIGFNEEFASHYLEEGKNVRAALKFDEMIALQMAYNDYSRNDIKAIFNGADIRSEELVRSYKDASLQLMGAYAMENSKNPLDMSMLLETEEGKEFYNKYHEAFLAAKDATGEDKLAKVNAFYAMVRADFPITQQVRTEGISHAENYDMITPYKLSVTPMIAAAEMMWQNLRVDNTLNDSEIDFLNDLGLCNYAEGTFDRIETITLSSDEDITNPTYEQYRNSLIKVMQEKGIYYIDDEHRELTKLTPFQEAVNGNFDLNKGTGYTGGKGGTKTTTTTRQEVETHTETNTTYTTEEERISKPIPDDVKAQIDAQIEAENAEARRIAEIEAEKERQRLQAIADEEARRIAEEVRRDEIDLQNDIANANSIINRNNSDQNPNNDHKINESDFGDHDVHFDSQHQDGHGNLNNSVQNITTDSTGDQTNQSLPDPNATGAEFDRRAPQYSGQTYSDSSSNNVTLPTTGSQTTTTTAPSDANTSIDTNGNEYQFWVEEDTTSTEAGWTEVSGITIDPEYQGYVQPVGQSNEDIVNDYVNSLENPNGEDNLGYQYTR